MTPATQWRAKVLATRRSGRYVVATVSAPGVADRCRPGHFASASVAGAPDSALLMRRQVWVANSSASGRDGGACELVLDTAEPGGARLAQAAQGDEMDVMAPLGRPLSVPRGQASVLMAAVGSAAAPLIWLAGLLGQRGCRVQFVYLPDADPFGLLDARRVTADVEAPASEAGVARCITGHLRSGIDVVYSAGPAPLLTPLVSLCGDLPHQVALSTQLVCAAGSCTACTVPVRGRDGQARDVRACTEGPVFNAELVRWAEIGATDGAGWAR